MAKSKAPPTNLSPHEQKTFKTLKQARTIEIAPADKGNAAILIDLIEYNGKIRTLLACTGGSQMGPMDPHQSKESILNALLPSRSRANVFQAGYAAQLRKAPPAVRAPKGAKTCNPKVPLAPLSMSRHTVLVMSQVTFLSGIVK